METPQGVGKHGSNSETRAMVLLRRNWRPLSLIRNDKKAAEGLKRKWWGQGTCRKYRFSIRAPPGSNWFMMGAAHALVPAVKMATLYHCETCGAEPQKDTPKKTAAWICGSCRPYWHHNLDVLYIEAFKMQWCENSWIEATGKRMSYFVKKGGGHWIISTHLST